MNKTLELEQIAEIMGIMIVTHIGGEKGRWYPDRKTVSIRKGLHPIQHLCTLAHELGHAHHGHSPSAIKWIHTRQEREADQWAAQLLINKEAFRIMERECDGHEGAMAEGLGVTIHLIQAWKESLHATRACKYCPS